MLNKPLYDALVAAVGHVNIVNEDDPGTYHVDTVPSGFARGKQSRIIVHMDNWGEVYSFCDPVCKDHKARAFICHRYGTSIQLKSTTKRAYFSTYLACCHNAQCQRKPEFRAFLNSLKLPVDYTVAAISPTVSPAQSVKKGLIVQKVQLPNPAYSLTAPETPDYVKEYLEARGFNLDELCRDFGIRMSPMNASYLVDDKEYRLQDDRIIIPIQQHLHQIAWQGRLPTDDKQVMKDRRKYYNLQKGSKRSWLYNFDKALLYPEVIIFEGVTNVWRTGLDAIALFGSNLSIQQTELMRTVWSYDGNGIICLDEDKWCDNQNEDIRQRQLLIRANAFSKGIAILRLRNGDAAQHSHNRMRQLKRLAHMIATNDIDSPCILDEKDIHDDPLEEEQEPRFSTIPPDKLREILTPVNDQTWDEEDYLTEEFEG